MGRADIVGVLEDVYVTSRRSFPLSGDVSTPPFGTDWIPWGKSSAEAKACECKGGRGMAKGDGDIEDIQEIVNGDEEDMEEADNQ
jgi:hypothetical protein